VSATKDMVTDLAWSSSRPCWVPFTTFCIFKPGLISTRTWLGFHSNSSRRLSSPSTIRHNK
jgi:hypothetical protein